MFEILENLLEPSDREKLKNLCKTAALKKTEYCFFFKTNYRLMQVKSIAECSKGSILQYFRPSLSYHLSLRSLFCLFLSGCFTQVLLYIIYTLKFLPLLKIGRDQLEPWWVLMPFFYYFIIACGLILNVRVYLATFSVNSMPGI